MKKISAVPEFGSIATKYDFLNHLLSFGQDYYWRRIMFRELAPEGDDQILDLATGTGDSAKAVVSKGVHVVGVDISPEMLIIARRKTQSSFFSVVCGSAYNLPIKSETFSGGTCAFGFRNMRESLSALREIYRVLKKGGRMVFLEFTMPQGIFKKPYSFYLKRVLPFIAGFFSDRDAYRYLGDSIEGFYSPDEFAKLILEAGFSRCEMKKLSMGCVFIHKAFKE